MTPYKHNLGQLIDTDIENVSADRSFLVHLQWLATEAAAAGSVHAAITGKADAAVNVTTAITNPPYPRNLVITPGGTTADVAACTITVEGTNYADEAISEDFVFAANATSPVAGNKAFKTVTKISIPQQDGAAATFAVTFGDKLGLPYKLAHNTLLYKNTFLNNTVEGTEPAVTVSDTAIESNTIDLNNALDGHVVDAYFIV